MSGRDFAKPFMILTQERDRLHPCHREKKDEFSHRASGDEGLLQLSVQIGLRTTSFSLAGQDLFLKQRDQISPRRPAFNSSVPAPDPAVHPKTPARAASFCPARGRPGSRV